MTSADQFVQAMYTFSLREEVATALFFVVGAETYIIEELMYLLY